MKNWFKDTYTGYAVGVSLGVLTIIGCASSFPWRFYATSMPDECYDHGKLLGKSGNHGWPDIALNQCKPDPDPSPTPLPGAPKPIKLKCITVLVDDFYSLKADDEKCHVDLQRCQNGPKP